MLEGSEPQFVHVSNNHAHFVNTVVAIVKILTLFTLTFYKVKTLLLGF